MGKFHTHGPHSRDPDENPQSQQCTNIPGCKADGNGCTHEECHGMGPLQNCQWHDPSRSYRCWHEGPVSVEAIAMTVDELQIGLEGLRLDLEVLKRPGRSKA